MPLPRPIVGKVTYRLLCKSARALAVWRTAFHLPSIPLRGFGHFTSSISLKRQVLSKNDGFGL
jgi:hypothetical protein